MLLVSCKRRSRSMVLRNPQASLRRPAAAQRKPAAVKRGQKPLTPPRQQRRVAQLRKCADTPLVKEYRGIASEMRKLRKRKHLIDQRSFNSALLKLQTKKQLLGKRIDHLIYGTTDAAAPSSVPSGHIVAVPAQVSSPMFALPGRTLMISLDTEAWLG